GVSAALDHVPGVDETVAHRHALVADPTIEPAEPRRQALHREADAGPELVVQVHGEHRARIADHADPVALLDDVAHTHAHAAALHVREQAALAVPVVDHHRVA